MIVTMAVGPEACHSRPRVSTILSTASPGVDHAVTASATRPRHCSCDGVCDVQLPGPRPARRSRWSSRSTTRAPPEGARHDTGRVKAPVAAGQAEVVCGDHRLVRADDAPPDVSILS